MEFFKQNTCIDFMKQRFIAYAFSLLVFVASLVSLGVSHLELGLDFTGGMQIELHYPELVDPSSLRQLLFQAGYPEASVVRYGSSQDVQVTLSSKHMVDAAVFHQLVPQAEVVRVDYVGPQVGKQLAQQGVLAIVVSLIGTMIYIALRFEIRFALSAAIALIHDPVLILGVFSLFHIPFDLISLAALLTVIGYSLNDTVVIFDRVRENFIRLRKMSPYEVMNTSINQTLSRTIMTSGLTLMVVVVLYCYGGAMLQGFALALMIGIVIGTYSSIYVAGSLALAMGLSKEHLMPVQKQKAESYP